MIEIHAVKLPEDGEASEFERLIACFPHAEQAKIKGFRRFSDSMRALASRLLVRTVLLEKTAGCNGQLIFTGMEYGKQAVENTGGIRFNSAHSGRWAVCAFDYGPIGIDIERIRTIDFDIRDLRFSEEEYKDLMENNENERTSLLYDLWTLKESYVKAVGKGLSIPFDSFTIRMEPGGTFIKNGKDRDTYRFRQYRIDPGYSLSVCAMHDAFPPAVFIKGFQEISAKIPEG
ncbi:MAG: 4'-phosphopantetheinyl transferase superfamily protein [Spirochaetes bacterium]|nr:4'-phosphopantetheinyl transferase superfamily protein [Spirochaetota bacterium]